MSSKTHKSTINVKSTSSTQSSTEDLSIDENDKKILRVLNWDARLSYREIARQTKLSTTTVIERLKRMKVNRIIKGYFINLDGEKLGYSLSAIIELVAPKLSLMKAMEDVTNLPNVYAVYHTTGDVDAIIIAKFKNVVELRGFLNYLYTNLEIQRSETRIIFNTLKEDFRTLV